MSASLFMLHDSKDEKIRILEKEIIQLKQDRDNINDILKEILYALHPEDKERVFIHLGFNEITAKYVREILG